MIDLSLAERQIHHVNNFQDLVSTPFQGEMNAICWSRSLVGDFSEIVNQVSLDDNMAILNEDELRVLALSDQGQLARKILLEDIKLLKDHGAAPILNVIKSYERDDSYPFFPTDVYSYHVDRSPVPTATFLCTYVGSPSEILPNAQVQQKILVPEIRTELKKLYDGPEKGFESFLKDYFFDLHYLADPIATATSLGLGHLWRLAVDHPQATYLPCVHRAPMEEYGERRLLMIC